MQQRVISNTKLMLDGLNVNAVYSLERAAISPEGKIRYKRSVGAHMNEQFRPVTLSKSLSQGDQILVAVRPGPP